MPRYSPKEVQKGNRNLLFILLLLVAIIVAFIVAISASRNDPAKLLSSEVDSLEKLQSQQAFADEIDSAAAGNLPIESATSEVAKKPEAMTTTPAPKEPNQDAPPITSDAVANESSDLAEAGNRNGTKLTGKTFSYKVKKGDNLSTISRKFNVYIDPIKKASNLTEDLLDLDQELLIPVQDVHEVQSGETLSTIANKYGVKPELIKKANNLPSDDVSSGIKLAIPLP